MDSLDSAYEIVVGVQPTDEARQRMYTLKETLGINDNDAFWSMVMAHELYLNALQGFPAEVAHAAKKTLDGVRVSARAEADAAMAAMKGELASVIGTQTRIAASAIAREHRLRWSIWVVIAIITALGSLSGLVYWNGSDVGEKRGYVDGYEYAKEEGAAASWAATPYGRRTRRFAAIADLIRLAECSGPGWYVKNGACIPGRHSDNFVYGWRIARRH